MLVIIILIRDSEKCCHSTSVFGNNDSVFSFSQQKFLSAYQKLGIILGHEDAVMYKVRSVWAGKYFCKLQVLRGLEIKEETKHIVCGLSG